MADNPSLKSNLAASLPIQQRFVIHHLSTPPNPSPALYSAPPGQVPEKTTCESHFLSVTIRHNDRRVQIFALEVLIYATQDLITLFVSKADSTGYIHLLKLPKGTPSPLRTISSIFITHLVESRQRKDRQLVVALFARAQDQYLFPGSIENPGKHVLDDRGLIKWWCRVFEPVLQSSNPDTQSPDLSPWLKKEPTHTTAKAYLRVPSCDLHETRSFFPPHVRRSPTLLSKWHPNRDPLRDLAGRSPTFPERCLIPRFPDDPKSRFVDELDEELTEPPPDSQTKESPSKGKRPGRWKSVRSLEQFWELMAFRQECSSGRLVGFLWAVFTPAQLEDRLKTSGPIPFAERVMSRPHKVDGPRTFAPVVQPPFTPPAEQLVDPYLPDADDQGFSPETIARTLGPPAYSPPAEASVLVLPPRHYARINRLLLRLDYANLEVAAESSERWIDDVGICAGKEGWGFEVVGEMEMQRERDGDGGGGGGGEVAGAGVEGKGAQGVNTLDMGLVRKKKRGVEGDGPLGAGETGTDGAGGGVNVLATGLVRKKPKIK
ncbi:MAG: hypothetical protein L6R38_009619 [Xanthoria sp. 2 TBL-2021]|nr:MAG: hypothetical protein L6R38_009619 [Xanthoria sp. 2 TBL-2021]